MHQNHKLLNEVAARWILKMTSMIEYGVSQTLIAEFEMLRETVSIDSYKNTDKKNVEATHEHNIYKYSSKTIDKLAQYLVCRNYGKACLELAYLCWPIVRYQEHSKGLLHFFWIDESITPNKFENAVRSFSQELDTNDTEGYSSSMRSPIAWRENGLVISSGAASFKINAHRVSLLSALLEILVSNMDGILGDIESRLATSDEKCVVQLASYLQKLIYAFLKPHLPTANLQNKYRYVHQWVSEKKEAGKLNDDDVLAFWKSAISEEGFVKYQNTLLDMVDYQFAFEQVSVQRELSFGNSLEQMSIDQSNMLLETVFGSTKEEGDSFTWLMDAPKFLTKREYSCVSLLLELNKSIDQFPLSILRADIFGQWQNTIIQQTRSKTSSAINEPNTNYTDHLGLLDDWKHHTANTLLCCAAVLFKRKDSRCITLLTLAVDLVFDESKASAFRITLQRLMPNQSGSLPAFTDIRRWLLQSQTLNQFFSLATKALAKNNRVGFKAVEDFSSSDIYELGGEQLYKCVDIIKRFRQAVLLASTTKKPDLSSKASDLDSIFQSDLFIFKSEFAKRHGDINE